MRTIAASRFKATCLAVLDDVARTGEPMLILKRGKPVARLVPSSGEAATYPQLGLRGSMVIAGDIVAPALPEDVWEALSPGRRRV